jgi:hypothetical protein
MYVDGLNPNARANAARPRWPNAFPRASARRPQIPPVFCPDSAIEPHTPPLSDTSLSLKTENNSQLRTLLLTIPANANNNRVCVRIVRIQAQFVGNFKFFYRRVGWLLRGVQPPEN